MRLHLPSTLLVLTSIVAASLSCRAQLAITVLNNPAVINFDTSLAGVFSTTGTPSGSITQPSPVNSAPFDSDAWALRAGTTPDLTLPTAGTGSGTFVGLGGTSAAGAISRGTSNVAGWGTSGLGVVVNVTSGASFGNAFGFRPSGTGSDNATIFLRVQNNTGQTVNSWIVDYNPYFIDIGAQAVTGTFSYSTDGGLNFMSNVAALGFVTPGTGTVTTPVVGDWTGLSISETTIDANIADNGYLILRWAMTNNGGVSDVNRVALDSITITAVPEPAVSGLLLLAGVLLIDFYRRRI